MPATDNVLSKVVAPVTSKVPAMSMLLANFAEVTALSANRAVDILPSAILAVVTLSSTMEAVTTALAANWSAPTASSAILACVTWSLAIWAVSIEPST